MSRKFAEFIFHNRHGVFIFIVITTLFFAYHAFRVDFRTEFGDLLPQNHPYVKVHNKFRDIFGGANVFFIEVRVREGDIFNATTLGKISRISSELQFVEGINRKTIFSLGVRKAKEHRITKDGVIGECLMWPEAPKTQEEIEYLRKVVYSNEVFYGPYVSFDSKSALISGDLYEWGVNYKYVFDKINGICDAERDANHEIHLCGEPLVYGHVHNNIRNVIYIFFFTIAVILILVYYYFRVVLSMIVPCISGIVSAIWGLGIVKLLGYDFDPLILVIPFLITARAVSHSVQMVERYHEEYEHQGQDIHKACVTAFSGMFAPGLLGIVTDAAGILVIGLIPIPLMKKLAFICGFWAFSIIFSALILLPITISYFAKAESAAKSHKIERFLTRSTRWCIGRGKWINLAGTAIAVCLLSILTIRGLYIGDPHPGSSLLWQDSQYNKDVGHINRRFNGIYPFLIAVEGNDKEAVKNPKVLHLMERFQRFIEEDPNVGGSRSAVDIITRINMIFHEGDPRWKILPNDIPGVGSYMYIFITGGDPGDFDQYADYEYRNASIIVQYKVKTGDTIREAIAKAKNFFEPYQNQFGGFKFSLAGGVIGTMAAINEVVGYYSQLVRYLIYAIILIFCSVTYGSLIAGIILVIPVALADFLSVAYMAFKDIGLNINTLPVASVGVGIGLDYGVYVLSRIREEYQRLHNLDEAILAGVTTSGKAVTFTATTLISGVIFWYFISDLRFQGEMGFLLAFIMFFNMLGAIFLIPTLVAVIKPKFIYRQWGC